MASAAEDWMAALAAGRAAKLRHPLPLKDTLLPYQKEGVAWVLHGCAAGGGCILADEMGLGKTIQAIAAMRYMLLDAPRALFLVVAPTSVVPEWGGQLAQWGGGVKALLYTGDAAARAALQQSVNASRSAMFGAGGSTPFTVLVTSYELLARDVDFLASFSWHAAVFDEAHRLKNPASAGYGIVADRLRFGAALLLTGTPVQNNLAELHALLSLVHEPSFPRGVEAAEAFATSAEGGSGGGGQQLGALLGAAILRRTVASTGLALPPLRQVVVPCPLTPLQRTLYLSVLHRNVRHLLAGAGADASGQRMGNVLSLLQTVCNHPYLIAGVEPEPYEEGPHLVHASGKLAVLDALLTALLPAGHRVLLFSHFARSLDVLQDYCNAKSLAYERLDGSVRGDERWDAVRRFQAGGTAPSLFLLSTRAGGQGLTLTQADTVILFDSGMNPAWDEQAIRRAHRLGQERPVLVLRLLAAGTAEEVILARAARKLALSRRVLALTAGGSGEEEPDGEAAPPQELLAALQAGTAALLGDGGAGDMAAPGDLPLALRKPDSSPLALSDAQVAGLLALRTAAPAAAAAAAGDGDTDTGHLYWLDGQDFSAEVRASAAADAEAWDGWLSVQGQRAAAKAAEDARAASGAAAASAEELAVAAAAAAASRKARAWSNWQRTQARWATAGYTSTAVCKPRPVDPAAAPEAEAAGAAWEALEAFHFLRGNVARPATPAPQLQLELRRRLAAEEGGQGNAAAEAVAAVAAAMGGAAAAPAAPAPELAQVIIHAVDNSGEWARGGVFSAIDGRDPDGVVAAAYAAAAKSRDLALGDAHLVRLPPAPGAPPGSVAQFVALLVCLQRSSAGKRGRGGRGAQGGGISLHMGHLETALTRLARHWTTARGGDGASLPQHAVTVHCPRLGAGIRGTSYYAVERILRKVLLGAGLHTSVYYYRRGGGAGRAAPPPPAPPVQDDSEEGSEEESEEEEAGEDEEAGAAAAPPAGKRARVGGAGAPPTPDDMEWWVAEAERVQAATVFPAYEDNVRFVWDRAMGDAAAAASVRDAMVELQTGATAAAASGNAVRAQVLSLFFRMARHALALRAVRGG